MTGESIVRIIREYPFYSARCFFCFRQMVKIKMFKVKEYSGSYEVVLLNMLEVTSKYPLLIESAAEVTCNVIGSTTRSKYTEYVWLGHTGAKAYVLLGLVRNNENKMAEAILLEGDHWGIQSIIQAAINLVDAVFIGAHLRDRRAIIIELCKMVHDTLLELNYKKIDEISKEDVKITLFINEYGALLDVEYIEDVMGFWEDLIGTEKV